jgi:hypothetical protein
MGHFPKGAENMSATERQFLETLAGHFAWLQSAHPRKAKSSAARKAKQCVITKLRMCQKSTMRAAA